MAVWVERRRKLVRYSRVFTLYIAHGVNVPVVARGGRFILMNKDYWIKLTS